MNPSRRRTAVRTVAALVVPAVVALGATACGGNGGSGAGDRTGPGAVGVTAPSPTVDPTATTVARVGQRYAVGVGHETYVDPSRPTTAVPGYAGAPDRTFPVTVWYPATGDPAAPPADDAPPDRRGAPYPLVLFSHGYAVTPEAYEELLTRWAAAGYVVAAPTYPLLSGVPAGPSHEDYDEVFADERFVLDAVLTATATTATATTAATAATATGGPHPLAGLVDRTRIATAGQSDGEVAAFGAGFLECCRDPRVRAVIAMAGNLGNVNNPVQRDNGVPILHLVGEADELQASADALAWDREHLGAPRWIVTLVAGTHAPPYRDPADPHFAGVVEMTTAFLDGTLKGDRTRLAAVDGAVAADPARFRLER